MLPALLVFAQLAASEPRALAVRTTSAPKLDGRLDDAVWTAAPEHSELILVLGDDHFSINGDRSGAIGNQGIAWLRRWLDPQGSPVSESGR